MAILKMWKNAIFGVSKDTMRIENLRTQLEDLGDVPQNAYGSFAYLIRFFNIVSSFEDEGKVTLRDFKISKKLNFAIFRCGRDEFGMNRTSKGEEVTINNVWLGDVCGLFTHPAAWWIKQDDKTALDQISRQKVIPFVSENRRALLELCNKALNC